MTEALLRRLHVTGAILVSAAAGVLIGISLAPADSPPATAEPEPRVGLPTDVVQLPLPAGWKPLHRRSPLPGLSEATAVQGRRSSVALDIRPPEHSSLLPGAVVEAAGGEPPRPQTMTLGTRVVWRYELPGRATGGRMVALTLPTSAGVVTIACEAQTVTRAGEDCEPAMSVLRVRGASVLAPAPEAAARIVLPRALERLNRQRSELRRALAATRSAQQRHRIAGALARAYRAAAASVRPVAAGTALRLSDALARLAEAHEALALASLRRDAAAGGGAGAAIDRAERHLPALLRAVSRATPSAATSAEAP